MSKTKETKIKVENGGCAVRLLLATEQDVNLLLPGHRCGWRAAGPGSRWRGSAHGPPASTRKRT